MLILFTLPGYCEDKIEAMYFINENFSIQNSHELSAKIWRESPFALEGGQIYPIKMAGS